MMDQSILYLASVPIGNLGDITLRAIEVLKTVDFIIAEDTRYSIKLLNHLKIKKKMYSYYKPLEEKKTESIIKRLKANKSAALITDSGTPGISDPGYVLIKRAILENILIVPLPGPSALLPGLISSGLRCERFIFLGFLPKKPGLMKREIEKIADFPYTMIFYESPRRIEQFLKIAAGILLNRQFCLCKEISKKNEKFIRGDLKDYSSILNDEIILGEIVIIIEGKDNKTEKQVIKIDTLEDIYSHFRLNYQISKNHIKDIIQKKR
jgi:16S rRNA (cytidine1402-2'-O)-methyltransferase